MPFDTDKLKELFKDKRVLIGAAVIGGIAGLYVLSRSSGGGALQPSTPLDPQQPQQPGASSGDSAGLQGQIAELTSGQSGLQSLIQSLSDQFNAALGNAQNQNQSALQSVIDQVNSQLGSGAYQQNQTVPDFAGFSSQLYEALASVNTQAQRVANTGNILRNLKPGEIPTRLGGTLKLPSIAPPKTPATFQFPRYTSYRPTLGGKSLSLAAASGYNITSALRANVTQAQLYAKKFMPVGTFKSAIPRKGGGASFR